MQSGINTMPFHCRDEETHHFIEVVLAVATIFDIVDF